MIVKWRKKADRIIHILDGRVQEEEVLTRE